MNKERVDVENLTVTGTSPQSGNVSVSEEVLVIINQAYGPNGDHLVGVQDVSFDGFPALSVYVKGGGREGMVHLSPIHGDRRKKGLALPSGTKCELFCPVSREPLRKVDPGTDGSAEFYAVYLSPKLSPSSAVFISDVWDDHTSRVIDNDELVSAYLIE
jgi:hypothetical protein